MEDYQIILSPNLGISAADFVTAWNEEAEARNLAEAHLATSTSKGYDPTLIVAILLSVATGTASNLLSDLIMRLIDRKKDPQKHIHIEAQKKLDGTRLLVVDIDEK